MMSLKYSTKGENSLFFIGILLHWDAVHYNSDLRVSFLGIYIYSLLFLQFVYRQYQGKCYMTDIHKVEKGTRSMNISLFWSHLRMYPVHAFQLQRT